MTTTTIARLIESVGHVGQIDDFPIKSPEQHSFLLTGFSRHTPCRLSSRGMTASATAEASPTHRATRIQLQHGTAVNAEAITSQRSKPFSLDDDGGLSDSDPDPSSSDDGCSSEDEQRRSHTSKHSRWSDLDEQRFLASRKRTSLGRDLQQVPRQNAGCSTHALEHDTA